MLILVVVASYLSIKYLVAILPANHYEDRGVYTFLPYQMLSVQVQNTRASGRDRRMNPTKTAYMVYLPGHQRERLSMERAGSHP